MKHFAVMDDPVALSQLLDATQLADVLVGVTRLHAVAIGILDRKGAVLGQVGEIQGAPEHRKMLEYNGDIVGRVVLSRLSTGDAPSSINLEAIADHVATVLVLLLHSAYARHLTTSIHEAAMEESFSEISDRNQRLASAIERLEELERLKSNFLATISHELRTPLTSIIGYSEMMVEGLAGELSQEQTAYSRIILVKAEQLLQLITSILDVSLIEARSLRLAIEPLDMEQLVSSVVGTMKRDAQRQRILLERADDAIPRALGDSGKLRQVLLQLLANAIKFSPDGGDIKVSVAVGALFPHDNSSPHSPIWRESLGERFGVRVTIEDEGIGVAADKRASIFDAFYQADSSSTRAFGGTGLGLSLAKSYVVAHGGFLWLDSSNEVSKKGSRFTFSLPAVPEELAAYVSD